MFRRPFQAIFSTQRSPEGERERARERESERERKRDRKQSNLIPRLINGPSCMERRAKNKKGLILKAVDIF